MDENDQWKIFSREEVGEIENEIKKNLGNFQETLKGNFIQKINNQIEEDIQSLENINIIISNFVRNNSPYQFLRTEPLAFYKIKNFDVSIFSQSKKMIILIEVEKNLSSSMHKKMSEFQAMCSIVEDNRTINNISPFAFFSQIIKVVSLNNNNFDYVLSSPILDTRPVQTISADIGLSLNLWTLGRSGTMCKIVNVIIKSSKKANFNGLKDKDLSDYLHNIASEKVEFSNFVGFIFTSSNYLKAINITIPVIQRIQNKKDGFTYEEWENLFKQELSNYTLEEKKLIFRNYVEFGMKCNFIEEYATNKFRIITRFKSDMDKLMQDIKEKIVFAETKELIEKQEEKIRKEILIEWTRKKDTGGKTLFDFGRKS